MTLPLPGRRHRATRQVACAIGMICALSAVSALAQPPEASAPAPAPALDGKELAMAKCSTCHGFERALAYKRTRVQWAATVDYMKDKGLEVSDAEAKAIVDYLAATLPPDP